MFNLKKNNMILVKSKSRLFLMLVMLTAFIMHGCSLENDEFLDRMDLSMDEENQTSSVTDYGIVVRSQEFKEYDVQYGDFVSLVREVTSKMSQEDKDELLKLAALYRSDQEKYQSLLEYKAASILGEDSTRISNAYSLLLEKKKVLLENKTLNEKIAGNEELISMGLREKWMGIGDNQFVPIRTTLKTRSENDKIQRCKDRCYRQYEIQLKSIDSDYACASAANIISCMATGGTSFLFNLAIQTTLGAAYIIACEGARDTYQLCVEGCNDI